MNKLGAILKDTDLPDLPFTFQTPINAGTLQPGWDNQPYISACNVSAKDLLNPCPTSLTKALIVQTKTKIHGTHPTVKNITIYNK